MTRLLALATLAFTVTAWAADTAALRLSAFSVRPSNGDAGFGASVDYPWSNRFSASLGISREKTAVVNLVPSSLGNVPRTSFEDIYPVDLLLRYRAASASWIEPYAGAGVRYLRAGSRDHYRPALNAGVRFALTSRLALEADWKHLYNQSNALPSEPIHDAQFREAGSNRVALGLGWKY